MVDKYLELKEEFNKIDKSNIKALRKWFEEHEYLNVQDLSIIIGKCSRDVRALRRSVGIKQAAPKVKRRASTKTIDIAELPSNWATKEWLLENLPIYGSNAIIRAAKCSTLTFYKLLKRLEIPLPGRAIKNPCCTKAWCHKHYVELGYSARQCAKLAGITHPTFVDWLIKFNIQMRVCKTAHKTKLPTGFKLFVSKLNKQPIVRSVIIKPKYLQVNFKDGLTSRYAFSAMSSDAWRIDSIPKIVNEYEDDLVSGSQYNGHISIPNIRAYNRIEREIALHTFVRKLYKRGWIDLKVPQAVLDRELENIKNAKESNYIRNGAFTSIHGKNITKYISLHFLDHRYIWRHFSKPWEVWKLSKELLHNTKYEFNIYNLVRFITKRRSTFRFPNPALYTTMFKRLGITGTFLDLHLGTGSRAIACGVVGCHYRTLEVAKFREAVKNGFTEFLNLKYEYYDNSEVVDVVFCDNDLSEINIEYALSFANRAKCIIAYVPNHLKNEYQAKYSPRSMVKVVNHPMNREPNYFFIW